MKRALKLAGAIFAACSILAGLFVIIVGPVVTLISTVGYTLTNWSSMSVWNVCGAVILCIFCELPPILFGILLIVIGTILGAFALADDVP